MSIQTGDDHLQAGREALRLALGEHAVPGGLVEDIIYDAQLLKSAQEHLETAALLFKAEGRALDEARARIDIAEVYLKMPPTHETCAAAEASCRASLEVLDTTRDRTTSMKAYILLVEAMVLPIGHAPDGFEKERHITQTLGVLRAADYLAAGQDDLLLRARVDDALSRALGERFSGDRDANLLEAIRAGQHALLKLHEAAARSPLSYASLQVHLGNCYMKLDGPRARWIAEGLAAYRAGLAAVDPQKFPRLHRVLAGNMAMVEALIADENSSLPEKEMMGRFGARLQSALNDSDMKAADAVAWETIQWAWSLDRAPNVWVAEAHKLLGRLLLHRGDASRARDHFYSAAALLSALAEPGDLQQAALLGGARQLLGQTMDQLGQADRTVEFVHQADSAFIVAREHCARGTQLLAGDPKTAHDELDRALALFPYDPLALFYRGVASMNLSNPEAARHDFDGVLGLQPRNIAALVNRASLRKQLGDIDGALTDYASVLDVDPRNATALYNRSVMHVAAGDYEAAVNDLDRLIDAHPAVTAAHTLRTECLDHLRRHRNFLNETERENI